MATKSSGTKSMAMIADLVGVSQATVSRVANNSPGVKFDIAKKVNDAFNKIGYVHPRRNKRVNRQGGPSSVIALLILDDHYIMHIDVLSGLLNGICRELRNNEMTLMFINSSDPAEIQAKISRHNIAGLLLAGASISDQVQQVIENTPSVWLSSHHDAKGDHTLAGNEAVGKMAARYLVDDRGHKRIAFFNPGNGYPAFRARRESFEFYAFSKKVPVDILSSAGSDANPGGYYHVSDLNTLEKQVDLLVTSFLKLKPQPTGIFIPYDLMTAMAYRVFTLKGIKLGRDLEIISCNNQPTCLAGLYPRPTTIDIGAESMGMHSVEQLLWRIKHPREKANIHVIVEPQLIKGECRDLQ